MTSPLRERISPPPACVVQRACSVCGSKKTATPCPACGGALATARESLLPLQAKFYVNPADDVYEREADRVADTVLQSGTAAAAGDARTGDAAAGDARAGVQLARAVTVSNLVQREADDDETIDDDAGEDGEGPLQMEAGAAAAREVTPAQEARVTSLRGGGAPLDAAQRKFFEPRFGHDFGGVRIHNDAGAAASARELGARAYTVGNDIVFGAGEFQPGSPGGMRLLAHELTHVIQQHGGSDTAMQTRIQREAIQRKSDCIPPMTTPRGGVKRVRVLLNEGLVVAELTDDTHFSMPLDPDAKRTNIAKGTYQAIHTKGDGEDCIVGVESTWHVVNKEGVVPRAGGWAGLPTSAYELIVSEMSPAFEADPADIARKKAKAAKDKSAGEGPGAGAGKGQGSGAGGGKGAGEQGKKDQPPAQGGKGGGGQQSGGTSDDTKLVNDFQKKLGETGTDVTVTPDLETAEALKELTDEERTDLARYLRDAKAKADEEGKAFDVRTMINYYKNLSPSDRELLRTNLELAKSPTGATELPAQVKIALDAGSEKTAVAIPQQVDNLNGQLGKIHAMVANNPNPHIKPEDFEPINLNEFPAFTEMMMLEGLLAGASSKSPEIQTVSKELMESIHGIRDYVLEEIAWIGVELAATHIIAALTAAFTAGLSEVAAGIEAAYAIKRLNDLRKFLQKVEQIYNTIQKIRALFARVIGVVETYKRIKAQYDVWSVRLEKLQAMLDKAGDGGDDIDEQIEKLEDEMIEQLQKSLDDPQGLGGLLEQFYIPADTTPEELKEILFNIPKGIEAFRDLITFYGGVNRTRMEDVKTLAYKGVRAGALLYPFVGYLAMTVGNELKRLMEQPGLTERLIGIITRASDKASKRTPPTKAQSREQLRKVKKNKDQPKKKEARKANDKKAKDPKDKPKSPDDPKSPATKPGADDKSDDPKAPKKKPDGDAKADDPKAPKKQQDDKDKKDEDARKKGDPAKDDKKEAKEKQEREEKAQKDSEWAQVVAKVGQLQGAYPAGVTKGDLMKAARTISKAKAHKTVAGGPKISEDPGKGTWHLAIARKGLTPDKAEAHVLMNERARWNKGRRAVEAKVAGLPDNGLDQKSIEAAIRPLQDAFAFKTLRVGARTDSRQGLGVFGAMPTGGEHMIATIDDVSNLHTGTASDPIPIRWYKEPGNYAKSIKLRGDANNFIDYPMASTERVPLSRRGAPDIPVRVGIDMKYLVQIGDKLSRNSTPRSGTKQKDYRDALTQAGFDWAGRDADHVLDLGFAGADDFNNLWPLERARNQWAFKEKWYRQYYVEYRDPKSPREAKVDTLFNLRGFTFEVKSHNQNLPKVAGGRTDPKQGTP